MAEQSRQDASWEGSVSIRADAVTLAKIDLLVDQGCYESRSDFYARAAAKQLSEHAEALEDLSRRAKDEKRMFFLGITQLGRKDLLEYQAKHVKIAVAGYGVLIFEKDMDDLIVATVESISVRGKVYCSERIRKIYLPNY